MSPVVAVAIRSVIAFVVLVGISRLVGQKYTVVLGVALGAVAAAMSVDPNLPFVYPIIAFCAWGLCAYLLSLGNIKSLGLRTMTGGQPTVLIQQGKVLQKNLKKARLTVEDMMTLLREQGVFKLADVEFGLLEPDGQVSVMKKSNLQPLTPQTQGIAVELEQEPTIVIVDGQLIYASLEKTGYSQGWLLGELHKLGAKDVKDVFLAQIDSKGSVYVDLYDDTVNPSQMQVPAKPLLLASLKKIQADFEGFALQTENQEAKKSYTQQAQQLQALINKIQSYLRA